VPNGAPQRDSDGDEARDDAILQKFSLRPKRFVLAVGRLVPEKEFHVLIEAFRRSGSDADLVIVGAANHADDYARSVLAEAGGPLKVVGLQPHADLGAFYRHAALFVLPSSHEGLPIAALEAAAFGCPMLLSDIPANREIGLADNSYFPVGRTELLAEKLARDPSDFSVDSDCVRHRFDWDTVTRRTAEIFDKHFR
jgi:glycosyltransferase involved in cell wall biosynthesis